MQVAKLTAPTATAPASAAEETGSRAEQFARVLKNAFFGTGSKAVARSAEQGGPEPAPRSELRSHELRGKEVRSTERSEQRPSEYRDSAAQSAVQKKASQPTSHTISGKPAETPASTNPAGQAKEAAAPKSDDAAAEATGPDAPPAEQAAAPAEDKAAADARIADTDLLLILGLLQNQEQATTVGPDAAVATDQAGETIQIVRPGTPATAEHTLTGAAAVPAAPDAAAAAPVPAAPAVPVLPVAEAAASVSATPVSAAPAPASPGPAAPVLPADAGLQPVLPEAAAASVTVKATETSAAALLSQQQTVTPEEFAAIQQALVMQGQARPATNAATQTPAAGKAGEGKDLVIEVQPASSAVAKTLVDQSALLAMQDESGAAQDAALQQLQAQPQTHPAAADAKFAAMLQAPAEPVSPQASGAAGLPNTPPHLGQQASPLANPGTPAPQAAQHAASHAAARQLGAYIPAGEQVAVQIRKGAAEGLDKISIRLDPGNLGKVDIKMEVGHDGRLMAVISADKPETLAMLQRDVQNLEQSLRDAGLKTSSDSLSFTLRDQNQAADGREARDGQAGNGRNRGRGHDEYADTGTATDPAALAAANAQRAANARGGLDIRI